MSCVFSFLCALLGTDATEPPQFLATYRQVAQISELCRQIAVQYKALGWQQGQVCQELPWMFDYRSEGGYPLIYWSYSDATSNPDKLETTLILGGVHPDELTPIHLAFSFAHEVFLHPQNYKGRRIVIAPLINPDGFFKPSRSRTNANGIDLNRNFPTLDWTKKAHVYWHRKRRGDSRYFPGHAPHTEQGTRMQVSLIESYQPDKIISIHAPLGLLDYDGPGYIKTKTMSLHEQKAREIVKVLSINSKKYKIIDYNFYPGSLGNFAGNERLIPTITLELESANPKLVNEFWKNFRPGIWAAVQFNFKRHSGFLIP